MRRGLGKSHLRVVAIDDGAFRRTDRRAAVAGVVCSGPMYVEGILRSSVEVDGADATDRLSEMLRGSPHLDGVRAILLDGVAVGGFNLVDLVGLSERTGRPVVSVTRQRPDLEGMRRALATYFADDFARRWALVRARPLFRIPTGGAPLWASVAGCRRVDAVEVVRRNVVRGLWPEPLRLAHLVARAFSRPVRPPRPKSYGPARVSNGPGL